jgi:hypothetical protein
MTPIRANIGGPFRSTTSISASIAACHLRGLMLGRRKLCDVPAGILERDEPAPRGSGIGSSNDRFQPRSAVMLRPDL